MRIPVLTAVTDAVWEAELVAALERGEHAVVVQRRCVDLADLLATATTGLARAVLLSADLRRLDREALTRLAAAGLAVIGLVPPDDEDPERRLRQLGVTIILPSDTPPGEIAEAVVRAVDDRAEGDWAAEQLSSEDGGAGDPGAGAVDGRLGAHGPRTSVLGLPAGSAGAGADRPALLPETGRGGPSGVDADAGNRPIGQGRLIAVWGPTGAPGRTTIAVGVASELAALERAVLLVDADVYGGVVAQVLGMLDEAPGLAAACRLGNSGALDLPSLAALCRRLGPRLQVLTGIARADRWPELRPAALEVVLHLGRTLAEVTVVDCGFGLEQDEELAYDTAAPRRNGATLTVLEQADTVLAVGSADPVGLQRLVRGLAELREAVPQARPVVVVNRLRGSAVPGDAAGEVRAALRRYAGVEEVRFVAYDRPGLDAALAVGRMLGEQVPGSPARADLEQLARSLVGAAPAAARRRTGRRRS